MGSHERFGVNYRLKIYKGGSNTCSFETVAAENSGLGQILEPCCPSNERTHDLTDAAFIHSKHWEGNTFSSKKVTPTSTKRIVFFFCAYTPKFVRKTQQKTHITCTDAAKQQHVSNRYILNLYRLMKFDCCILSWLVLLYNFVSTKRQRWTLSRAVKVWAASKTCCISWTRAVTDDKHLNIQLVKLDCFTRSVCINLVKEERERERSERKIGNLPVVQDLGPAGLSNI